VRALEYAPCAVLGILQWTRRQTSA
jgi:hypothetical protein